MATFLGTTAERYAIYRRDRFTCLYCGCRVVPGAPTICQDAATIDHVDPPALGGAERDVRNEMTCCACCNRDKSMRGLRSWLFDLSRRGVDVAQIRAEIQRRRRRRLNLDAGTRDAQRVADAQRHIAVYAHDVLAALFDP